jgi:hypothetical protein
MARVRIDAGPLGYYGLDNQSQRVSIYVFLWAPVTSQPNWETMDDLSLQDVPIAGREWLVGRY